MLEPRFPLELKVLPRVVDDLVEGRGFGGTSLVVLELILCLFPRVSPEHTGLFGEVRLVGVLELVRSTDRGLGQASGRAMCLQSREPYVHVWALDLLGNVRLFLDTTVLPPLNPYFTG
jgi:hypothetical protein